jgi:hypothetical protein
MSHHAQISVLTGDLIASTAMSPSQVDAAFTRLADVARDLRAWHDADLLFSRNRGDGWQVALTNPVYGLRSILAFRAGLKALGPSFDTYIGMATGTADLNGQTDLNTLTGAPFVASGLALENLKAQPGFAPKIAIADDPALAATATLADHLAESWTPKQAETLYPTLIARDRLTYTELAETLGKSRQVVTKALSAAGFEHLSLTLNYLETHHD